MKINIEVIPHDKQRYETVGDYWVDEAGTQQVRISDMGNDNYAFLVAMHELTELYLCQKRGIKEPDIMAFDEAFEAARQPGNEDEPGDDPKAPYRKEHFTATTIERIIAAELGVDWGEYDKAVMNC